MEAFIFIYHQMRKKPFIDFSSSKCRLNTRDSCTLWLPVVSLAHLLAEVTLVVAMCSPNLTTEG